MRVRLVALLVLAVSCCLVCAFWAQLPAGGGVLALDGSTPAVDQDAAGLDLSGVVLMPGGLRECGGAFVLIGDSGATIRLLAATDEHGRFMYADKDDGQTLPTTLIAVSPHGATLYDLRPPRGTRKVNGLSMTLRRLGDAIVVVQDDYGIPIAGTEVEACPEEGTLAEGALRLLRGIGESKGGNGLPFLSNVPTSDMGIAHMSVALLDRDAASCGTYSFRAGGTVVVDPGTQLAEVCSGAASRIIVTCQRTRSCRVIGQVRAADGKHIKGVLVRPAFYSTDAEAWSGLDGWYDLTSVRVLNGVIKIELVAEGYRPAVWTAKVARDDKCILLNVTLDPVTRR